MRSLQTLGELKLLDENGDELLAGRRKALVLLAYIARRRPRTTSRAELATLLWGEQPDARARASLRQVIFQLKSALGERLRVEGDALWLVENGIAFDLALCESAVSQGRYADAIAMWRGDFLASADDVGGESYRFWIEEERERLRKRVAWAFEQLVDTAISGGDYALASQWAARWCDAFPVDERAHVHLIRALRLQGRVGEARAQRAVFVARYRDTFEREPSAAFQQATADIESLRREPSEHLAAVPPALAHERDTIFVGRTDALRELHAAWDGAQAGAIELVLVEGDDGIGKTRLCEEFLRILEAEGIEHLTLTTAAVPMHVTEPWATLRTFGPALAGAPGLIGASATTLAELTRLAPALREHVRGLPAPSADDASLRDAFAESVTTIAAEIPVVCHVDDFEWADPSSAQSILALAAWPTASRLLILLSASTDAIDRDPSFVHALERLPRFRRLTLTPLSLSELGLLVAARLPLREDEHRSLTRRVHAEAHGNPRFAIDIIQALIEGGHAHRDGAREWHLSPELSERPLPVPPNLRNAIARRFEGLSPEARAIAETIARMRRPMSAEGLAREQRVSETQIYGALDELVGRHLLREETPDRSGGGQYTFVNQSTRATVALAMSRRERGGKPRAQRIAVLLVAVGLLVAISAFVALRQRRSHEDALVAIGLIRDYYGSDTALAAAVGDMLATNLARVSHLHVLSTARMLELARRVERLRTDSGPRDEHQVLLRAAELGGATELIEGALYGDPRAANKLRLDVRRVELRTGVVVDAASVEASNEFQLVDRATARLAANVSAGSDTLRIVDATTTSITAYRLYEEGLRAYHRAGDVAAARALFTAALREDSTMPMPHYYLARLAGGGPPSWPEFAAAERYAGRATERERLLIEATAASERQDPAGLAIAETLAIRYPTEPQGWVNLANDNIMLGRMSVALGYLSRLRALDTVRPNALTAGRDTAANNDGPCLACDALAGAATVYQMMDSGNASIEARKAAVRQRPGVGSDWLALASTFLAFDRYTEAFEANRRAQALATSDPAIPMFYIEAGIRTGDFSMTDRLLEAPLRGGSPGVQYVALWWHAISLRQQGRFREALREARKQRAIEPAAAPWNAFDGSIMEALVLFELGEYRESATRFDSLATRSAPPGDLFRHRAARHRAWMLTHAATAFAAAGDRARVARLADSIQALGAQSSYGRDQLLHHHVRGLLFEMGGPANDRSAEAEFRNAVYSWTMGYTRTNFELARLLLARGRPAEAIAALRPALHGSLESSNLYVTRTELQELLARAFDASHQADSARFYYGRVVSAWAHADPELATRRAQALARVRALGGQVDEASSGRDRPSSSK